jgi:hypothetical protein
VTGPPVGVDLGREGRRPSALSDVPVAVTCTPAPLAHHLGIDDDHLHELGWG